MMKSLSFPLTIAAAFFFAQSSSGEHCYFSFDSKTLNDDIRTADVVFIAFVQENLVGADGVGRTSVLSITHVVKDDSKWLNTNHITINRYIDIPSDKPPQAYLIFAGADSGKLDAYRGVPIASPKLAVKYLQLLRAIDAKNLAKRMAFHIDYLLAPDEEIAKDAQLELQIASIAEMIAAGKSLDAGKLRGLMAAQKLDARCLGRLSLLLAGCGTKDDARFIRKFLEGNMNAGSVQRIDAANRDALLIAYTVLSPKEGFAEIHSVIADPKGEFLDRYAALRALKHLTRHPVPPIDRRSMNNAIALMIDQEEMADLAIEELRRLGDWSFTAKAIEMSKKSNVPILQRAVIRYALTAPKSDQVAAAYIAEIRLKDPERLANIIEIMKSESQSNKPPKRP